MKFLLILNDAPYGTERSYNALRLAGSLARSEDTEVRIFLIGDAVGCAVAGHKLPDGYYHIDRMGRSAARHGARIGCCGTCLDARGFTDTVLLEEADRSSLEELTDWSLWADKVITF